MNTVLWGTAKRGFPKCGALSAISQNIISAWREPSNARGLFQRYPPLETFASSSSRTLHLGRRGDTYAALVTSCWAGGYTESGPRSSGDTTVNERLGTPLSKEHTVDHVRTELPFVRPRQPRWDGKSRHSASPMSSLAWRSHERRNGRNCRGNDKCQFAVLTEEQEKAAAEAAGSEFEGMRGRLSAHGGYPLGQVRHGLAR